LQWRAIYRIVAKVCRALSLQSLEEALILGLAEQCSILSHSPQGVSNLLARRGCEEVARPLAIVEHQRSSRP
jgi:hypothetical protein